VPDIMRTKVEWIVRAFRGRVQACNSFELELQTGVRAVRRGFSVGEAARCARGSWRASLQSTPSAV